MSGTEDTLSNKTDKQPLPHAAYRLICVSERSPDCCLEKKEM